MTLTNLYISNGGLRLANVGDVLTLGEAGRGRQLCTLQQVGGSAAPRDGGPVRARVVNRDLVALSYAIKANPLVIVKTNPGYRRGCSGSCSITGAGREIASGQWAYGDAGRTGSGFDSLVEIDGPCGLDVTDRQLVLADTTRVEPFMRRSLVSTLLADDVPWVRETLEAVVRLGGDARSVWSVVLAEVEAAEDASVEDAPSVAHYDVSEAGLATLGIALQGAPEAGLSLAGDVAVAGSETWALVHVIRGGGKRWSWHNLRTVGVTLLRERGEARLYRIDSPESWRVDYDRHQDGAYSYTVTHPPDRHAPADSPSDVGPAPHGPAGGNGGLAPGPVGCTTAGLQHNPFAVALAKG
jgi:hypothetical protein